jgi:threonine/homoserine/homoserine lactone efflux protein
MKGSVKAVCAGLPAQARTKPAFYRWTHFEAHWRNNPSPSLRLSETGQARQSSLYDEEPLLIASKVPANPPSDAIHRKPMPTADTLLAFFGVSVLLGLSPGPDNVFVLLQSALHGRRAGLFVVLGLCTGILVHTSAVALGLAAVLVASTTAFTALKLVGAAYLGYLAWQALRARPDEPDSAPGASASAGATPANAGTMYRRGIIMNLSNPKVAIFFLAFLPQFVQVGPGSVALQIIWLGGVFMLATLLTFGAIAWFAASAGQAFTRSPRAQLLLNRLAGCIFLGLAARLVLNER